MRIVHLINYFQPLLGYQETHLARVQQARGHEVTILTSDRYYPFPEYEQSIRPLLGHRFVGSGRSTEHGLDVWRLGVRYENTKRRRVWMKGVTAALAELRPDAVHAHGTAEFLSVEAALAQKNLGFRLVYDSHDHWVTVSRGFAGRLFYAVYRLIGVPIMQRRSDAFVGITDETADILRNVLRLDPERVRVIELGVDPERFHRDATVRVRRREELGLTDADFLVIYTGKLVRSKGPELLVQALAGTPSNVKALLVGNGTVACMQGMTATIEECGLQGRVHFRPACPQAELPAWYSAADAACWPREASMAMLEAASCELPIIVIRGGLEARIANRNGLDYPEGDVACLSDAIRTLANDKTEAREMGRRGRELTERSFTWDRINAQFESLYENSSR